MWVERDENGRLYLWIVKPIRHKDCWWLPEQYGTHISSYYVKIDGASGKVVILSTGTLTSARTESALSAFPLRLLYINIFKKQKILNIIKKKHKNILSLEKSQHLLQRD